MMINSRFKISLVYFKSVPSYNYYISTPFSDEKLALTFLEKNKRLNNQTRMIVDFGLNWENIDANYSGKVIYIEIEEKVISLKG